MTQTELLEWLKQTHVEARAASLPPVEFVSNYFLDGLLTIDEFGALIFGLGNEQFLMTKEEAQRAQGLRYGELLAISSKFRAYCKTEDCACGLSWIWRLRKDDVFQPACALHDFWDLNWRVAKEINLSMKIIDSWFNRELQSIVTGMSYWKRLYYVPRARAFYWLVKKFRPLRWK